MRKGSKTKAEDIIAILRSVEVLISQGKTLALACKEVEIWSIPKIRQFQNRTSISFILVSSL